MRSRLLPGWLLPGLLPHGRLLHGGLLFWRAPSSSRRRLVRRRPAAAISAFAVVLATAAAGAGVLPRIPVPAARADVVTASQNDLRTGWDRGEPRLAPVSDGGPVGGPTFGRIFSKHLNGQIYAQPLVVGNTLIVATETNHVYGLNAATGAVKWARSLGKPEPWSTMGCRDLMPDIGITSAPVYDPATDAVYLVALVNNGSSVRAAHVHVRAERRHRPRAARLAGCDRGRPGQRPRRLFNPLTERQRSRPAADRGRGLRGVCLLLRLPALPGLVAGVNTSTRL